MFRTYLLPVEAAVLIFPVVVAVIMIPVAVRGYRRRGRAGGWSVLVFYSFVFYLVAALLQTLMPLPADTDAHCLVTRYAAAPQLEPFAFRHTVATAADGDWSPTNLVGLAPTWTTLLNLVLLLPLGVYLRYHLRRGLLASGLIALGTSLFFETTQYTGLWYLYSCPYRQFNVDDLTLNTLGAVIGWFLAGPLGRRLPVNDPKVERLRYGNRITLTRRALAYLLDVAGCLVVWTVITGLLAVFGPVDLATGRRWALLLAAGIGLVWFWLLPALLRTTPGKRAVLLRVERPGGRRAGFRRITVRMWLLYSPFALLWWWAADHTGVLPVGLPEPVGRVLPFLLPVAGVLVWVWSPFAVLVRGDRRAPYERWTDTVNLAVPTRRERRAARTVAPPPGTDGPTPANGGGGVDHTPPEPRDTTGERPVGPSARR
ncbi:VanZ family protein [Streptomyces calidiresistens]|uniref:VanZ family protein n=1 Tax=Streptomyces calidiresistens TaxID=1485586 RepID=A0A7W3T496_9ACTN|nr:VanZ family protein [Streptomyces calidiresistens]MBB0230518.1 VanZ family protein [Streptomyces calidiresistens]